MSADMCECSCASSCPMGRSGTASRCTWVELAQFFGCRRDEAMGKLMEWQHEEEEYEPGRLEALRILDNLRKT